MCVGIVNGCDCVYQRSSLLFSLLLSLDSSLSLLLVRYVGLCLCEFYRMGFFPVCASCTHVIQNNIFAWVHTQKTTLVKYENTEMINFNFPGFFFICFGSYSRPFDVYATLMLRMGLCESGWREAESWPFTKKHNQMKMTKYEHENGIICHSECIWRVLKFMWHFFISPVNGDFAASEHTDKRFQFDVDMHS